jgi:hypothetical protein
MSPWTLEVALLLRKTQTFNVPCAAVSYSLPTIFRLGECSIKRQGLPPNIISRHCISIWVSFARRGISALCYHSALHSSIPAGTRASQRSSPTVPYNWYNVNVTVDCRNAALHKLLDAEQVSWSPRLLLSCHMISTHTSVTSSLAYRPHTPNEC